MAPGGLRTRRSTLDTVQRERGGEEGEDPRVFHERVCNDFDAL